MDTRFFSDLVRELGHIHLEWHQAKDGLPLIEVLMHPSTIKAWRDATPAGYNAPEPDDMPANAVSRFMGAWILEDASQPEGAAFIRTDGKLVATVLHGRADQRVLRGIHWSIATLATLPAPSVNLPIDLNGDGALARVAETLPTPIAEIDAVVLLPVHVEVLQIVSAGLELFALAPAL